METVRQLGPVKLNMDAYFALHKFNEVLQYVVTNSKSDYFLCDIDYKAKDNNGPHWHGYRCFLRDKEGVTSLYIHFGLVFLPETKIGLMVEIDRRSNTLDYKKIWDEVKNSLVYDVNKEEEDYLKLFFYDDQMVSLNEESLVNKQIEMITNYFVSCCNAIIEAAR